MQINLHTNRSLLSTALQNAIQITHLPHMLHWEDRNSMANSIESRVPFLDHRLVEKSFYIPDQLKLHQGETKYILRESMKPYVPEIILKRKDKIGFATPTSYWTHTVLKSAIMDMVHSSGFLSRDWWHGKQIQDRLTKISINSAKTNCGKFSPANCGTNRLSKRTHKLIFVQTNPSLKRIQEVAFQLQDDLLQLDIDALDVSESVKSYFRYDLTKLSYVSKCNAFILYHLLLNQNSKKSNAIIVDHGAGIGLFSFLVKRMGYTCISHDLFDEYLDGIRKIGTALNARPDYFVLGDTNALIAYCHFHDLSILGLASRNVIEHLPDYREFLMILLVWDLKVLVW